MRQDIPISQGQSSLTPIYLYSNKMNFGVLGARNSYPQLRYTIMLNGRLWTTHSGMMLYCSISHHTLICPTKFWQSIDRVNISLKPSIPILLNLTKFYPQFCNLKCTILDYIQITFFLPWKITEKISSRSVLSTNVRQYLTYQTIWTYNLLPCCGLT